MLRDYRNRKIYLNFDTYCLITINNKSTRVKLTNPTIFDESGEVYISREAYKIYPKTIKPMKE